ncbi:MAG: phospholipase D-like domain-containing protein [Candidatus Thorarchaeota archaeon]
MRKHHQNLLSVFIISLMLSGFIPLMISPAAATPEPVESFAPAEFTWQTFNKNMNVTTFVSPDGSRDALWKFLNSAEESIYVEIYGVNHPHIMNLIHEIHDTKPSIEMKFLIGWNSLGYPNPNKYVANNLTLLGYPVKWTNSSDFNFAHQKFLVIDNKTTIVHAGNWAKTSFPEYQYLANREWSIAMTDTDVAAYYLSVFDYDWSRGTDYDAGTHGTGDALANPTSTSTYAHPFATAGEFSGPMNVTPIFSPDTSLEGILYCINIAQATLDIQIPYFTSIGDGGEVDEVVDAILAAKDRGVTVRVITDEEKDFLEVAEIFVEHGIPIVWHDTRWFTANHNKGIIVDGRIVLISSINYSDGSISENREAGVIIENEDVARWYQDVYDFDWGIATCDEMDDVNLYWDPNIPTSSAAINVTVYAHMLYGDTITEVSLGVKIGSGTWNNYTITANIFASAEGQDENFFYIIPAQADGTNIIVQASVESGGVWHQGEEMVIRVRDSIGSAMTTPPDPNAELIAQLLPYIVMAVVAVIGALCYKQKR